VHFQKSTIRKIKDICSSDFSGIFFASGLDKGGEGLDTERERGTRQVAVAKLF